MDAGKPSIFDPERIGILGVCGWGGMVLNAAAMDTHIKATVASTMYNMSRVNANGYFDVDDNEEARYQAKKRLNDERTKEYATGEYVRAGRRFRSRGSARSRSRRATSSMPTRT